MKYIKGLENLNTDKKCAVTIGKLDALHRGHQLLVNNIIKKAGEKDCLSLVLAFDISPRLVLKKDSIEGSVITKAERIDMLEKMGVDILVEMTFDEKTIHMEPEDFIALIHEKLNMTYLTVGVDFRFGYKGRGDVALIGELAERMSFEFSPVEKLMDEGKEISSSLIRTLISDGDIRKANKLLGYDFTLSGVVAPGQQIGRTIDTPTINIELPKEKIAMPLGVYSAYTIIGGVKYAGIVNIGKRPTIENSDHRIKVEMHIFDFDGSLYDKAVNISLTDFIRPEKKFDSLEELKSQIERDIAIAKNG